MTYVKFTRNAPGDYVATVPGTDKSVDIWKSYIGDSSWIIAPRVINSGVIRDPKLIYTISYEAAKTIASNLLQD